jgi:hypothetical protein
VFKRYKLDGEIKASGTTEDRTVGTFAVSCLEGKG